jgi:hypothetical protein
VAGKHPHRGGLLRRGRPLGWQQDQGRGTRQEQGHE